LQGTAAAGDIAFESDIQTSPVSLPELEVGTNRIEYRDASTQSRQVRITHRWVERTAGHPPVAPADAIAPKDGATVAGTRITFRWAPAADPDGDAIADYHFELSEHADMRWPLSPNFEKLISRTQSASKTEWTVPYTGLLNPGTDYYWHVRARDTKGVWGPWSRTFRFRAEAPGVPTDVRLVSEQGGYVLHWKANPQGAPPVAYKVYGSNEKGFTVSDVEYQVFRGKGFVQSMEQFEAKPADSPDCGLVPVPANLMARVEGTSLAVLGWGLAPPNANSAFYRVVAVDAAGNESGPSDFAEVPRPMVVLPAEDRARVGEPYRLEPVVIRSIGDLRCRPSSVSSYNAAYWDQEEYEFHTVQMPAGLEMNPSSGLIAGRPAEAGTVEVRFNATDGKGRSRPFAYRLRIAE
jgi:hypothetical protein